MLGAAVVALVLVGCARPQRPTLGGPPEPTPPGPAIGLPESPAPATATRAAPRWEKLAELSGGAAPGPAALRVAPDAIQWRVRWSCAEGAGTLRMSTTPAPRRPGPLVSAPCPGEGEAYSIVTGDVALAVQAAGPWSATVEQQVETPLEEPPRPEMAGARVAAEGSFYDIERTGGGTARLYLLGDGRRFLRLENFTVSANTDLFVWLSEAPRPATSAEALDAPYAVAGGLKATLGSHNYEVPADLPTERIRSVVIWCQPVSIAYSAAALGPP